MVFHGYNFSDVSTKQKSHRKLHVPLALKIFLSLIPNGLWIPLAAAAVSHDFSKSKRVFVFIHIKLCFKISSLYHHISNKETNGGLPFI